MSIEEGDLAALSVAGVVQLMQRDDSPDRLRAGGVEVATAVLLELALLGRLGTVPTKGFFSGPSALVVLDDRPTGLPALDPVLATAAARGRPWRADRCLLGAVRPASDAVRAELALAGLVAADLAGKRDRFLRIADAERCAQIQHGVARSLGATGSVTDRRAGAVIDVLVNGAQGARREHGPSQAVRDSWYAAPLRSTVDTVLEAERLVFAPG